LRVPLLALVLLAACAEKPVAAPIDAAPTPSADAGAAAAVTLPAMLPAYPDDVVSLRLKRSIVVRFEPSDAAKPLGTIAADTRVTWKRSAAGPGCERWIEIDPRGWVCDKYLEPSKKPPMGVELPKLKEGELVPGTFGKVKAGGADTWKTVDDLKKGKKHKRLLAAMKVRQSGSETIGGKTYWKTSEGFLVDQARLEPLEPSTFVGVDLRLPDAPPIPFAWALSRKNARLQLAVRDTPGGKIVRHLPPRTIVVPLEASGDGLWQRTEAGWMATADLRFVRLSSAPVTTGPEEKWLDVDLDEQVVVAYDGAVPEYATLTSSGAKKYPTQPGVYRIWIKFAETDMNGQMGDEDPYSVATVPWTMFFARDLAFHTAYWHDRFGEPRSHGCLNLSPRDARALYFWATPDVPPGWSMAHGIVERPGSVVRIRSAEVPEPPFLGYAKRVHEARLARAEAEAAPAATP
jgi:hypothetical protein